LQIPETGNQEQKDADHQVLKEGDFSRRKFRVVA
jgi:hypothetical protein